MADPKASIEEASSSGILIDDANAGPAVIGDIVDGITAVGAPAHDKRGIGAR